MPSLTLIDSSQFHVDIPKELYEGHRHLTAEEIKILVSNGNTSEDSAWLNVLVSDGKGLFDANLISHTRFCGYVVLGRLVKAKLKYHSLELETGIHNSRLSNVVTGNDDVIENVSYLENYRLGDRVMLFNVQEISCRTNAKFGNGVLMEGESESKRICIGVANENDGRAIFPFESMIPSDAYLWSHYRDDKKVLECFKDMVQKEFLRTSVSYGTIGRDCVIKNTAIIKDAKIGECAYIKGAFKLKNVTIFSDEDAVSQIGEGVEMVNGIMGEGSHVFYQAVAVRFVIGKNCQLKYGARLLNSVLGDNSTVSCCELLNNLIFPFHEQHHNSSFLIATTVGGQSNIAAGATIGSNHNSRSPDGEIFAGRGFWPGLCSDFKHNSRFASFVLASKGSYQNELDVMYPFCLLSPGEKCGSPVNIVPAWWFLHDMFAIVRNKYKFAKRDKRFHKVQIIETNPFAPDTIQEVLVAINRLISLTADNLETLDKQAFLKCGSKEELFQAGKDFLHHNENLKFCVFDPLVQKKYGAEIYKPAKGYKMYRKITKYFASATLIEWCNQNNKQVLERTDIQHIQSIPLYTKWENVGGQIIPVQKVQDLFESIKNGNISDWHQVHEFYRECENHYLEWKARYSLYLLEFLYSCKIEDFTKKNYANLIADVTLISDELYNSSISSREKDFTDYYRCMTYRNVEEMEEVVGTLKGNDFLQTLEHDTKFFNEKLKVVFKELY